MPSAPRPTPGDIETAVPYEELLELVVVEDAELRAGNVARHIEAGKIDR
jgi:hypothetical protein